MLICDKKKIIFIHIPKNSGMEMSSTIQKIYPESKILMFVERKGPNIGIDQMHLYNEVIDTFISKDILDTYIKFCIIRNPYNRLYSAWNLLKNRYEYENVNDFIKYKLDENFIYGKELVPGDARVHYRPQFTFVYDKNDNKYVDFIIKYENLNNDIKKLNNTFDLNISEYGNNNTDKDYIQLFNKESIEKINKLYKKDFLLFTPSHI